MTKETADAIGVLFDRLIKPVVTLMFSAAVCWMGLRTITSISPDQFIGIVTAVILFWFGTRSTPPGGSTTNGTTTTMTDPQGATTTVAVTKP